MAVLLSDVPASLAADALPHKMWTRDEVSILESTGLFEGKHFELIDGELIDKMGKKRPHVLATLATTIALEGIFGREFVNQESPIDVDAEDLPRNEPEPDVIVLRTKAFDLRANPRPSDIALVVEVSDTTLRQDRTTKAALYARAGIPEYWVLDLKGRRLLVFREPSGGTYGQVMEFPESAAIAPLERPSHPVTVASLLPA